MSWKKIYKRRTRTMITFKAKLVSKKCKKKHQLLKNYNICNFFINRCGWQREQTNHHISSIRRRSFAFFPRLLIAEYLDKETRKLRWWRQLVSTGNKKDVFFSFSLASVQKQPVKLYNVGHIRAAETSGWLQVNNREIQLNFCYQSLDVYF
jgi:hypothetical protein